MAGRSSRRTAICTLSVYLGLILAAAPFAAGQDDELPEGPGKKIVQGVCSQCHEIEMVTTQNFTKDQWSHTVDLMVARGAHLAPDQIPTVVAYLAANFGKPETGADSPPPSPSVSAPASTSTPPSPPKAPSSLVTPSTAPPPLASTASSPSPQVSGNQSSGCRPESVAASKPPEKKRKGFWGFLRKKPKQPGCSGKLAVSSDNRGP